MIAQVETKTALLFMLLSFSLSAKALSIFQTDILAQRASDGGQKNLSKSGIGRDKEAVVKQLNFTRNGPT